MKNEIKNFAYYFNFITFFLIAKIIPDLTFLVKKDLTNLDSYNLNINEMGPNNIKGEIIDVCPKKGCWMNVLVETDTVFVKFKDYAFFVPKQGVEGKTIYMTGEINNDTISVEMLKHYAEDANKSHSYINSITEPKIKLNMIADGVAIKN